MTALLQDEALTEAFDRGAGAYDWLVAANPGYHRHLRRAARRLLTPPPAAPEEVGPGGAPRVLDLGCGTGASTAAVVAAAPRARIVAVDASAGMLQRATAKRWPVNVRFVQAGAEDLPQADVTGPFDALFAAYLVRNVADPDAVLRRMYGLLRPGGRLAVHDYTLSGAPAHRRLWTLVCRGIVMPLAALGPDSSGLYRHLWRSVLDFDSAEAFRARLAAAGFTGVRVAGVGGWQRGIVHTFFAHRPLHGEAAQ